MEEKKKLEKVIKGSATTKKKNALADVFIAEDVSKVKSYILKDRMVPIAKKLIVEIVEMFLWGSTDTGRKSHSSSPKISYTNYYDRRDDRPSVSTRSVYSYEDVIIEDRGDAEYVLTMLEEAIETYGMASVGDLYDLVGITGNYTDNKYGWTDLHDARIKPTRGGFTFDLPRVRPLK